MHTVHILLVLVQLFVTIGAFTATIFLRQCIGALARGLREKGIDFDGACNMAPTAPWPERNPPAPTPNPDLQP